MTRILLTAYLLILLAGVAVVFARAAFAQPTDRATTLVRSCVAEADFAARDCAAILHVLDRRSRRVGVSIEEHAERYVAAFRARRTDRLAWVLQLEPTCQRPAAWPAHLSWERYAPKCVSAFAMVRAFLAGEVSDPCRGRAMHWGSPHISVDVERAARAGWRVVRCGETLNRFYAEVL